MSWGWSKDKWLENIRKKLVGGYFGEANFNKIGLMDSGGNVRYQFEYDDVTGQVKYGDEYLSAVESYDYIILVRILMVME